jgi:hypothetical protein
VNVQEFKSRHSEVFNLGRHPKEFFVQRFGANHFRLIGSTYFVFVDSCWVAVDVDGFVYTERVICAGNPGFYCFFGRRQDPARALWTFPLFPPRGA